MKKIMIGSVFLLTGTLITISILITAALYVPEITSWTGGSRFWYAIFTGSNPGNISPGLSLGLPFTVGMILFAMGLIILITEYFRKEN